MNEPPLPTFTTLLDLASERVGGRALAASDEFFAEKENLLKPAPAVFLELKYTERGKWMDGWESRRLRGPGHDWCVIRLGVPGAIRGINVDTSHFRGNHPQACSLDVLEVDGDDPADPATLEGWRELLPRAPLAGHSDNFFPIEGCERATHVRLQIYPDGGVARLRVYGEPRPDWLALAARAPVDLLAAEHGGRPLDCSDRFFSEPVNLTMPGRSTFMGDGWETKRRRGPGHDWCLLALGHRGVIEEILVDTHHFKGNFPESCSLEGCDARAAWPPGPSHQAGPGHPADPVGEWRELLPRTPLEAHRERRFPAAEVGPITHARLRIYPDGGVSRLRLFGRPMLEDGQPGGRDPGAQE